MKLLVIIKYCLFIAFFVVSTDNMIELEGQKIALKQQKENAQRAARVAAADKFLQEQKNQALLESVLILDERTSRSY
jgi:hypothetical protein